MTVKRTVPGSAIALAVLGIAAVATFLIGMVQLLPQQIRESQRTTLLEQAEYAAWAGVEHALLQLKQARSKDNRYELSAEQLRDPAREVPHAELTEEQAICLKNGCLSYSQLLFKKDNATAVSFPLGTDRSGVRYDLLVWHRFESSRALGLESVTDMLQRKSALSLFAPTFPSPDQVFGDTGVDVIESTGISGNTRYALRVIVDPIKGTIKEVITPYQ